MTMSSEEITHHMARDFSMFLGDALGLDDAPADEFFDPIATVFGDSPTQESVVRVFNSPDGVSKLAAELNSWLEIDSVSPDLARQLLEIAITNNFGPDALQ